MTLRFEEFRESSGRLALALREPPDDEVDTTLGTVHGWALKYGTWANISSRSEGNFLETHAVGAYDRTIRDRGPKIRLLFQHGGDHVVGDRPLGGPLELVSDRTGLRYAAPLFDTTFGRDLLPALKAGLLGASVRFAVVRDRYTSNPKPSARNPKGQLPEREVLEARLAEVSIVVFPAFDSSSAGIRSATDRYTLAA